jgi:serine protease Do
MSVLAEIEQAVATAAETVGPAVVAVGRGAGVVVAPGHVLTNAHNVGDGPVGVAFATGQRREGAVVGADLEGDLAVVAVETDEATPITWADEGPSLGAAVLAFGRPGRGSPRVTVGFVSAIDQRFRGPGGRRLTGVEHTAPLARGSSGGPLVAADGRLLGIDTHRRGGGFYVALPVSPQLREQVDRLTRGEVPPRRRLGVAVAGSHVARRLRAAVGLEERDGLLVQDVDPDGAAARAGMARGDVIVAVDQRPVTDGDDLLAVLDATGDRLVVSVLRGERELDVEVTFDGAEGEGRA